MSAALFHVSGTTEPEPCPAGYYCKRGSPAPTPCVPGTYSDVAMLTSDAGCLACPRGHYCGSGTSAPLACPVATYNEQPRQTNLTACLQCPEHSLTDAAGAYAATACTCRNNFVRGAAEGTSVATCKCPAGYGFESQVLLPLPPPTVAGHPTPPLEWPCASHPWDASHPSPRSRPLVYHPFPLLPISAHCLCLAGPTRRPTARAARSASSATTRTSGTTTRASRATSRVKVAIFAAHSWPLRSRQTASEGLGLAF